MNTGLGWIPRDNELKDHNLWDKSFLGGEPPCVHYELKPVIDPKKGPVEGLYVAWITLDNEPELNSYTTGMVKQVIAGFHRASMDRSVVMVVFTAKGHRSFCTGGNTKEYAEYYSLRCPEYGSYMDLFNAMVDAILGCKKPVLCRVNGMRIAGGQEIGMACDMTFTVDTAMFGQAGPKHGSAPDGGSTDFLPWNLSIEDALWNCVSCESWSAYKMKMLRLVGKVFKVLRPDGEFIRNPMVITDRYIDDGEIVYGEMVTGDARAAAKPILKAGPYDFTLIDQEIDRVAWRFTNLFSGCLIKSVEGIRLKKKFFWDQTKVINRHWLAANMATEAYWGFNAFNNKKATGTDVVDFVELRLRQARGEPMGTELTEAILAAPTE